MTHRADDIGSFRAAVERAVDQAVVAARRAMPTPEMARVLETALTGFASAGADRCPSVVALTRSVYEAVRGDTHPAEPLAAACGLFSLGLDIADDLTDDELRADWQRHSPVDIQIIMVALLASLPQQ